MTDFWFGLTMLVRGPPAVARSRREHPVPWCRRGRRPAPCRGGRRRPCRPGLPRRLHQIDRTDAGGEVVGDADHDRGLAVGDRDERDHAGADLRLGVVGQTFEILGANAFDHPQHRLDARDFARSSPCSPPRARRAPGAPRFAQFAFQLPALFRQLRHALRQFRRSGFERRRRLARDLGLARQIATRAFARQRLDAAHAGRHRAFREDGEKPDIAQPSHMGAAAQFDRIGFCVRPRPW